MTRQQTILTWWLAVAAVCFGWLAGRCSGQTPPPIAEPTVLGTDGIVPIGRLEFFDIEGLTLEQFDAGRIAVCPSGYDVECRIMYERTGENTFTPVVLFRADQPNALNRYELILGYTDTAGKTQFLRWTVRTGKAPQPPPVDPVDPDTPPDDVAASGRVTLIVLRDPLAVTADQAEVILDAGSWIDQQDDEQYRRFTLDPDVVTTYRDQVDGEYPFALIVQDRDNAPGAVIRWRGELPDAGETLIEELKKWQPTK